MEKPAFVTADVTQGTLNALVKNIMSQTGATDPNEAVRLVNSGTWALKQVTKWYGKRRRDLLHPRFKRNDGQGVDQAL